MNSFAKGDVVRVQYASPQFIEEWMSWMRKVGPGDVGVVKFDPEMGQHIGESDERGHFASDGMITVIFPMIGTFGMHTSNLVLVQRAEK